MNVFNALQHKQQCFSITSNHNFITNMINVNVSLFVTLSHVKQWTKFDEFWFSDST